MNRKTEIRHLIGSPLTVLLDQNNGWKRLMACVPKRLEDLEEDKEIVDYKYNGDHSRTIELTANQLRTASDILFEEWGTSGRKRPNLGHLIKLCVKVDLFRVADEIAKLLNEPFPTRPASGPAMRVEIPDETCKIPSILEDIETRSNIETGRVNSNATVNENRDLYPKISITDTRKVGSSIMNGSLGSFEREMDISPIPAFSELMVADNVQNSGSNNVSSQLNIPSQSFFNRSQENSSENLPAFSILGSESEISANLSSIHEEESGIVPNLSIFGDVSQSILAHEDLNLPNLSFLDQNESEYIPNVSIINPIIAQNGREKIFLYRKLQEATENFSPSKELGRGGFGTVFLGRNLSNNVHIAAVKKLYLKDEMRQKFEREITILDGHNHENIVTLLGYSEDEPSSLCLVYEYVANGDLAEKLEKIRRRIDLFAWQDRLKVILGIASGIKYVHKVIKCFHRDIKPGNILLHGNIPKLCDFGCLKLSDSTTTTKAIGTNYYMAPEGMRHDISEKLDVFAFGVVMLEIITGLQIYDNSRNGHDLTTYYQNQHKHRRLLADKSAGGPDWVNISLELYDIVDECLRTLGRPDIVFVHEKIVKVCNQVQ